jgi:DNA mismatch repair protein MutL
MGKIIELNDHVRNMIAAGEVVERPLNVVKELVENSIDANSSVITINLLDSGLRKIEVIDNGDGMDEEDALKSFRRHATSKLKNEHDLYRISTLGFRGEAIPSIAAVSEFVLKTKKENTDGVEIIVKGSKFISKNTIAINKGTHISVNNLFYNTPARLKYMKSPNVELSYIVDIVEKIALSYPNISFKLTNNNQVLVQTSISNKIDKKICEIYNIETFKNMLYFEDDFDNTYLKAFISNSNLYKSKRNDITLIVNNRIVKNTSIISRVVEAYEGFIPVSKYPICVIYIDIDPLLVDVNVSPSKTLVKFSNEEILLEKLYENIVKTLKESLYKKIVDTNEKVDYTKIERTIKTKQEIVNDVKEEYTLIDLFQNEVETTKNENIEIKNDKPEVVKKIPYMEYIGQLMGTYLLFQNEEGL